MKAQNILRHVLNIENKLLFFKHYQISTNTYKVYTANLLRFNQYLIDNDIADTLPNSPTTVANYLVTLVQLGFKYNFIAVNLYGISWLHKCNEYTGEDNPTYSHALKGITRTIRLLIAESGRSNAPHQKNALTVQNIRKMIKTMPKNKKNLRDKLLLLFGFSCALRSSELVSLRFEDIKPKNDSLTLHILKSKGDQLAKGTTITINKSKYKKYCPVSTYYEYIKAFYISDGFLFQSIDINGQFKRYKNPLKQGNHIHPQSVGIILKRLAKNANIDNKNIGSHSLRRGMLVASLKKGAKLEDIKELARHKQIATTEHYLTDALRKKNITKGIL